MAGGKERALRGRIKSVESTKKITRAMELIAASRIVKAQQRVLAARPYSEQITEVIRNLASAGAEARHPILAGTGRDSKVAFIVITSDRGLAGGYSANVIKLAEKSIKAEQNEGRDYTLVCVGRKSASHFGYRKYDIDATFTGFSEQPTYANAKEIAAHVLTQFEEHNYDRIEIVYTQFLSAGTQLPILRRIAPIDLDAIAGPGAEASASYEYEPSPTGILDTLLPRYVEARIYAALLDAAASEHAARQRAMKAATDNATDLITTLSRIMNRARQDSITTEIMEIVGGAEALRQHAGDGEDLLVDRLYSDDILV